MADHTSMQLTHAYKQLWQALIHGMVRKPMEVSIY